VHSSGGGYGSDLPHFNHILIFNKTLGELTKRFPLTQGRCCSQCFFDGKSSWDMVEDLELDLSWVGDEQTSETLAKGGDPLMADTPGCSCTNGKVGLSHEKQHRHRTEQCSYKNVPEKFVFAMTSGHAGTLTLSNADCYEPTTEDGTDMKQMPIIFNFETNQLYDDDDATPTDGGIKYWAAMLKNTTDEEEAVLGKQMANSTFVPDMLMYARHKLEKKMHLHSEPESKLTYVDMGHHVNVGLLGPIVDVLGTDRVHVVRVARHRYDTVRSFASEAKIPCGAETSNGHLRNGRFNLCPSVHKTVLEPPPGVWEKLDYDQRVLWLIDEVEARWRRLLDTHPDLPHLELSYCRSEDFTEKVRIPVAELIGDGSIRPKECATHHHTKSQNKKVQVLDNEQLAAKDTEYWKLMQYDSRPELKRLIEETQQAKLCGDEPGDQGTYEDLYRIANDARSGETLTKQTTALQPGTMDQ